LAGLQLTMTDGSGSARSSRAARASGDFRQAPPINVTIFARDLLTHLMTPIYFPNDQRA
jgi:protocatechuate 3,4-dioxygenase beta subunit